MNPEQNYTKQEALNVLKTNNIDLGIIDKITPLLGLPIANNILGQFGTNKETLMSCLQELKGSQPPQMAQTLPNRQSAIFKELDQF